MKAILKRFLQKCILATLVAACVHIGYMNKSHAILGSSTAISHANFAALLGAIGFGSILIGGAFIGYGQIYQQRHVTTTKQKWMSAIASTIVLAMGLALLPQNEDSFSFEFAPIISENLHNAYLLSEAEIQSYNDELPQINLALQEVTSKINSGELKDPKEIQSAWFSYRDQGLISNDAFSAIQAVSKLNAQALVKSIKN